MSTTESPVERPHGGLGARARTVRGHAARLPGVVWVVAIALLTYLIQSDAYPSYDYGFALSTGQDILRERTTAYGLDGVQAPLPHPLTIAAATLAGMFAIVFGDNIGAWVFLALALLGFGLLVYATYRLGRELFSWPIGLLAAVLVFTSGQIFQLAIRTYGDIAAAGLVIFAAVLFMRDPRGKGFAPLGVLTVAGLLRPEVWILAGLLWLWLFRGKDWQTRFGTAALVALAPLLWLLTDLWLTGNALHSFQDARDFAEERTASLGFSGIPGRMQKFMDQLMTIPVVIGAGIGLIAGAVFLRRRIILPLLLGVIPAAISLTLAVAGDTLTYNRFYLVTAAMVALFCAIAVLGWTAFDGERTVRRIWQFAGVALVTLLVLSAIERVDEFDRRLGRQANFVATLTEARGFVQLERVAPYLEAPECDPVDIPGFLLRPYVRYWADVPPERISFATGGRIPARGAVLLTKDEEFKRHPGLAARTGRGLRDDWLRSKAFRRNFRPVVETRSFSLWASAECRTAVESRARAQAGGAPGARG